MALTLPTTLSPDAPDASVLLSTETTGSIELVFQWVSDDRHPISLALAWVHGRGGAYLAHGEGATPAEALLDLLADAEGDLEGTELSATAALALSDLAHEAVGRVCQQLCGEPLERAVFAEASPLPVSDALVKDVARMLKVPTYAPSALQEGTTPRSMENVRR